jgi:hypothetical protein
MCCVLVLPKDEGMYKFKLMHVNVWSLLRFRSVGKFASLKNLFATP